MHNTIPQIDVYVGIDVSKDSLDVHVHPLKGIFKIPNNVNGLQKLTCLLSKYQVKQIVCEATGGYEALLCKTLTKKGFPIWRVDPKRIKAFRISEGINPKNDKIDAYMLALFAEKKTPAYTAYRPSDDEARLSALIHRREALVAMIIMEENRLKHPLQALFKKDITKLVNFMKKQVKSIENNINSIIKTNDALKAKATIAESIPGIGKITSAVVIGVMPEIGKIENKAIAALLGVAPIIQQSGNSKGIATIKGGRTIVRNAFYMATVVAIRYNVQIKKFYEHLRSVGKAAKVAIVACMRKLIVMLNTMISEGKKWQEVC